MREVFRKKDLPKLTAAGRTKINDIIANDPTFPKLFPLSDGGRMQVGFMDELTAWLEARADKAAAKKKGAAK